MISPAGENEIRRLHHASRVSAARPARRSQSSRPGTARPSIGAWLGYGLLGAVAGFLGWRARSLSARRGLEGELQQTQERYSALFDRSLDWVYLHDFLGRFLDANPAALELLGYTREEVPSLTFSSVLDPEQAAAAMRLVEELKRRDHMDKPVEFRVRGKHGKDLVVEVRSSVIFHHGKPWAIQGIARDVTERKGIEQALRESEAKFRTLAENVHAAIGMVQSQRFVYANPYFAELSGYSVDELLTMDFPQLVHPSFRPQMIERARRRQRGEPVPTNYEFLMLTRSGEARWVDFSAATIEYHGQPTIIGAGFDITRRKRAEAALRDSEARLRLLCDTATRLLVADQPEQILGEVFDAVATHLRADVFLNYLVTPDGRRLRLNTWRGMDEATAKAMEFVQFGQPFCGIAARERRRVIISHVEACCEAGADMLRSLGIRAYACHPLMDHGVLGTISFCSRQRDQFTDEELDLMRAVTNQASMALTRQHLTVALEHRAAALDQANKAKDHFLAVLSHELRTPLTPVLATANLLAEDAQVPDRYAGDVAMIRRNVELEARLIDDLLDVTRIARGKIELDQRPVALCEVLRQAVEVCQPDIDARELHFALDLGDTASVVVYGDPARLQQVFWNLIKNAIKFTPHGGCIGVSCRRDGEQHVVAEVRDSGVGIEPELLPRMFNAFEQGERGTVPFGGLGLGLAIAKALVESHRGTIEAHSAGKGRGARFRVRLPVLQAKDISAPPTPAGAPEATAPSARGLRILLVEDHGDTARILARVLKADGHEVDIAADVATALDLSAQRPYDLLLSDLGLPDRSGLELMRELRQRGQNMPAIALSGYGQEQDLEQSRDAGFADHLVKPISRPRLQDAITKVAANRGDAPHHAGQ